MSTILLALNLLFVLANPSYKMSYFYRIMPANTMELHSNFTTYHKEACSPVIQGNTLYQGLYDKTILAQHINNKHVLWTYHTIGEPTGTLLYKDILFITTRKGNVYALDKKNGGLIWSYSTQKEILSRPVVLYNTVYIQTTLDTIYAFSAADGTLIWQYKSRNMLEGLMVHLTPSPYIENNVLYTGFSNGDAAAFNAATGTMEWTKKPKTIKQLQDIIVATGSNGQLIIFGSYDNGLFALNKKDGTMAWERRDLTRPTGIYMTDNAIYAETAIGKVYRLDIRTGDTIWETDLGEDANPTGIACLTHSIVLGTKAGKFKGLVILDKDSGKVVKYFEVVSGISAQPVVIGNNIYAVSDGGFLYCFEQK